jgi:hypothetical protein
MQARTNKRVLNLMERRDVNQNFYRERAETSSLSDLQIHLLLSVWMRIHSAYCTIWKDEDPVIAQMN